MEPAKNLAGEGVFWRGDGTNGQPEILRTPGYPAFLALCGLGQHYQYRIAQIVQMLLGVLLVYLTYLLGALLISPGVGLWAATLQSISIGPILVGVWILSEALFSLLITLAILLLVRHFKQGTRWPLALAAATSAVATYVRPVGFIFVLVVILVLMFSPRRAAKVAGFVLVFGALVTPWYVRNYLVAGYAGFSSLGDQNLLSYEAAGVWAKSHGIPVQQAQQELEAIYSQRLEKLDIRPDSAPAMRLAGQMGRAVILDHPLTFVRMHLFTSLNSLLPASPGLLQTLGITSGYRGTLALLQTEGLLAAVKHYFGSNVKAILLIVPELFFLTVQYLMCLAVVIGMFRMRELKWGPEGLLIVLTIVAFIFAAGPVAIPRFRVPIEPLLNIGAAAGLVMIATRKRLTPAL